MARSQRRSRYSCTILNLYDTIPILSHLLTWLYVQDYQDLEVRIYNYMLTIIHIIEYYGFLMLYTYVATYLVANVVIELLYCPYVTIMITEAISIYV